MTAHQGDAPPTRAIYVASPSGETGKSAIALGLIDAFVGRIQRVGVFRPVTQAGQQDELLSLLLRQDGIGLPYEQCVGVSYDDVHADPDAALGEIVRRYREVARQSDVVIVIGSDYTDVAGPTEFAYNAKIAANLAAAVVLVVSGRRRDIDDLRQLVDVAINELAAAHVDVVAVIANRADPAKLTQVRKALADVPFASWVLPEVPLLSAPTVRQLMTAVGGRLIGGDDELLDREAETIVVGGMTMEHILDRIADGALIIVPGDRSEVVLAMVAAHAAGGFPSLAGLLLNGGFLPSDQVSRLVAGLGQRLPMVATELGTFDTSRMVAETRGLLAEGSQRKLDAAHAVFADNVDADRLRAAVDVPRSSVVTPLIFEYDLIERARAQKRHIVLPEGDDDRILRAASRVLARDVADITLLGDETAIRARASELGLDIGAAKVLSTTDEELRERFAQEYAKVRAHKGMTVDRAREIVTDVSYFGTMMVHLDLANGMVSGATHTTAHTILPAFQIIGTVPGTSIVSSVFFMCLQDRILVYGDCAINPDPTADQLADIAISSAATAAMFGVTPLVAMTSYSSGTSGTGVEVDKVRAATELAKTRAPDLIIDGPIQYDAAVDATVGQSKMPGSAVAGQATVVIFPDLNTGNNTYKAVQRSSGAVAVGPVLQGLRRPINDLSRGALVQDIVNTIAITAVQAQQEQQ